MTDCPDCGRRVDDDGECWRCEVINRGGKPETTEARSAEETTAAARAKRSK